ncbi:MAG: hypothetical protein AAF404_04080 [Pseudomonadota bacterium]
MYATISQSISPALHTHYLRLRKLSAMVEHDRALSIDIENIASLIDQDQLTQ